MNKYTAMLTGTTLLFSSLLPTTLPADDTEHNVRAVKEHIIPAYAEFARTIHGMAVDAASFCDQPNEQNLQQLQQDFQHSMDAWQGIQHIRFGPIEFVLRMNRIQLWPDKRSSVSKHLDKLLSSQDPAALETERFATGSVAVQGFSALERLLYDDQVAAASYASEDSASRYRCAVIKAITANLATIAGNLHKEWSQGNDAYINFIASAADENDFYESDVEVSSIMLNNLHTELQVIVDQKLDRALDKSLKKARGTRAENWRSGRSLRNISINLQSLRAFYRLAFAPRLSDEQLNNNIETAFANTLAAVDAIALPLDKAVKDAKARPQVENLRTEASKLKALIGGDLPQSLGLSLGFNSLDGD